MTPREALASLLAVPYTQAEQREVLQSMLGYMRDAGFGSGQR